MNKQFIEAIDELEKEKGIAKELPTQIGRASCRERV